jgi:hypothetical protein
MTRVSHRDRTQYMCGTFPQGWKSIAELWENYRHGEIEHV